MPIQGDGRAPLLTLLESSEDDGGMERSHPTQMQSNLGELDQAPERLHKEMLEWVTANHAHMFPLLKNDTI